MRNSHKIIDIEEFVNFKINNKQLSQSNARAYNVQKKYSRILDSLLKIRENKKKQLNNIEYQSKKIKKSVWDRLVLINNAVQNIQKQRFQVIDRINKIDQLKYQRQRDYQQSCQSVAIQQRRLQQELKLSIAHSQYYFQEKMILMQQQMQNKSAMLRRISQIEPLVKLCQKKKIKRDQIKQRIQKLRQESTTRVKDIWILHQNLQQLTKKSKQLNKQKQLEQKNNIEEKKVQIVTYLKQINQILLQHESSQQKIQQARRLLKQKRLEIDQYDFKQIQNSPYKQIKIKQIRQKMFPQKQTKLLNQLLVNQELEEVYVKRIIEWQEQIGQDQRLFQELQVKQKKLVQEQNIFNSQVEGYQATLKRLNQNLNKA